MSKDRQSGRNAAGRLAAAVVFLLLAGIGCPIAATPPEVNGSATAAGAGVPASQPGVQPTVAGAGWFKSDPSFSFAHVQPGVRSEFYVDLHTAPAPEGQVMDPNEPAPMINVMLDGPGVLGEHREVKPFRYGEDIRFTWSINRFGDYSAVGDIMVGNQSEQHFFGTLKVR
ncbi:MAG: hypothetical protein RL272_858 [Candidatus Parcubacteria bacterium]|jgi:hypothetical protein